MSAAHYFGKERRVSGAHKNDERVNALKMIISRNYVPFVVLKRAKLKPSPKRKPKRNRAAPPDITYFLEVSIFAISIKIFLVL